MNRFRGPSAIGQSRATPQTLCQKCLKRDKSTQELYFKSGLTFTYGITVLNARPQLKIDHMPQDLHERSSLRIQN